jgi:hypothetical protein
MTELMLGGGMASGPILLRRESPRAAMRERAGYW